MKAAVVFTISALLLYVIFSGRAESIWNAITGVASNATGGVTS